jgi:hypothetical protein
MATPMMFGGLLGNESPLFASKPPKAAAPAADTAPAAPVQNKQFASKPQVAAVPSAQTDDQKLLQEKQAATDAQIKANLAKEANVLEGQKAGALETRESVNRSKALMEQADRDTWAEPAFNPTKNQPMEIGKIFSLIATMGVMSGGAGKMGAMQAMNAMTGMLKGYQAGDQEAYERAKIEYDEGMKTIQAHNAQILKHLETALSLEATDREAAAIEKDLSTRLTGQSSVSTALGNAGKWQDVYELHLRASELHNEISKIREQANIAAAAETRRENFQLELARQKNMEKAGETAQWLNSKLGTNLNAAQATLVSDAASSIDEAKQLQSQVMSDPTLVGREGQIRQLIDRSVRSAISGQPDPADAELSSGKLSESEQKSLVFAKRFAAYLIKYEKSLLGGGKNFTVQFQARWNALLNQNQFNAAGLNNLLEQQKNEIAANTTKLSNKITRGVLEDLGTDMGARAVSGSKVQYTGSGTADDPIIIPE